MQPIWSALHREEFDPTCYLYHYTSFETALKILYSDTFRLSPVSNTNDTAEQKCRVLYSFERTEELNILIRQFEREWKSLIINSKLLCFSQDHKKKNLRKKQDYNIFDVSGRGFALPRMWAQYSNNNGVCIIVKKDEFKDLVLESYPNAILKPVSYFTDSDRLRFTEKMLRQACSILNEQHNPEIVSEYLLNESLRNYAFFSKSNDWANECEFRVFLPTTKPGYMEIHGVKRCIAGLVIGEKMDASKAYVLQKVRPNIPKRQIVFEASRCILKSFRQILEQEKGDQYVDQ